MGSSDHPITSRGITRRLALNACDCCRRRKTKCNEKKPQCSRCVRLGLGCVYTETVASKKSLSVTELASTLQRIEDKLSFLTSIAQKADEVGQQHESPATSTADVDMGMSPNSGQPPHDLSWTSTLVFPSTTTAPLVSGTPYMDTARIRDELSLSSRHSVAPQHLLTWSCSPIYLSALELQYPMELEVKRPQLPRVVAAPVCLYDCDDGSNQWLSRLSVSQVNRLTSYYFEHFHPACLILDEATFYAQDLSMAIRTEFTASSSTCIVLFVCALGSIAAYCSGHHQWAQSEDEGGEDDVGIGFFNVAIEMFREIESTSWTSCQCLLLMGSFYSAKSRVHDAWSAIHRACCTILILVPLQDELEAQQCQLFWIAYLQESQILAEFDFPASGLGKLAGTTELPLVPEAGVDARHAKYQFFFLALISMRKLLNRILYHVYCNEASEAVPTAATSKVVSFLSAPPAVIYELDRQIEEWREMLPVGLRFAPYQHNGEEQVSQPPLGPRSSDDRLHGHLVARYYAAKSIVHRPFLYQAFHCGDVSLLSDTDKAGAQTAIECAFLCSLNSGVLQEPLPLLLHPINTCRGVFALELQLAFLRRRDDLQLLPSREWQMIPEIRSRIEPTACRLSPAVARDLEILQMLDALDF